ALDKDPGRPQAYALLGSIFLYSKRNFSAAEQAMVASIERGGAASFHVYHDHEGAAIGTGFQSRCEGALLVFKSTVKFAAFDGIRSFEVKYSDIREAKANGWSG